MSSIFETLLGFLQPNIAISEVELTISIYEHIYIVFSQYFFNKNFLVTMRFSTVLIIFSVFSANGFLNLNRAVVDFNPSILNVTLAYINDAHGQSYINATFTTFVTITWMKLYLKVNMAEDQYDKEYRKVVVSSVFDIEKVFKGMQSNVFINAIFSAIRNSMAFEYKLPLPPVSGYWSVYRRK